MLVRFTTSIPDLAVKKPELQIFDPGRGKNGKWVKIGSLKKIKSASMSYSGVGWFLNTGEIMYADKKKKKSLKKMKAAVSSPARLRLFAKAKDSGGEKIAYVSPEFSLDFFNGVRVTNQNGGYSIGVLDGWQHTVGFIADTSIHLRPPGKNINKDSEYVADIIVRSFPNPDDLSLVEFFQQPNRIDYFAEAVSVTDIQVNGFEGARFSNLPGLFTNTVVALKLEQQVVEIVDVNEGHQVDGLFDLILSTLLATP